jgi:hypothetical protein
MHHSPFSGNAFVNNFFLLFVCYVIYKAENFFLSMDPKMPLNFKVFSFSHIHSNQIEDEGNSDVLSINRTALIMSPSTCRHLFRLTLNIQVHVLV